MSAADKDPRKFVRREMLARGGVVVSRNGFGVTYQVDGVSVFVRDNISMALAKTLMGEVAQRGGRVVRPGLRHRSGVPRLDLERCTASEHAKDRLRLMQQQNRALSFTDVLHALRLPERVVWSDRHWSWVWVRDPLAVPVSFSDDGWATIRTVLWSSDELFELFPRPGVVS